MRLLSFAALLVGHVALVGCGSDQVFTSINSVKVQRIGPNGLEEKFFEGQDAVKLKNCLYKSAEIPEDEGKELLQATFLIQVKDNAGERSFELYTASNLKGNKGKYYSNDCIYALVQ